MTISRRNEKADEERACEMPAARERPSRSRTLAASLREADNVYSLIDAVIKQRNTAARSRERDARAVSSGSPSGRARGYDWFFFRNRSRGENGTRAIGTGRPYMRLRSGPRHDNAVFPHPPQRTDRSSQSSARRSPRTRLYAMRTLTGVNATP